MPNVTKSLIVSERRADGYATFWTLSIPSRSIFGCRLRKPSRAASTTKNPNRVKDVRSGQLAERIGVETSGMWPVTMVTPVSYLRFKVSERSRRKYSAMWLRSSA